MTEDSPEREYGKAVGLVALVTGVGYLLRPYLQPTDVAMLYLLAVVATASWFRLGAALLASVLGIAAFDLVFVPPYYRLEVHDASYLLTFAVMLAVAVVMSRLAGRVREQAREAMEREHRTAALYALERDLDGATSMDALLAVATDHLRRFVRGEAVITLVDPAALADGRPVWPTEGIYDTVEVRVAASYAYQHGESAGMGTRHGSGGPALAVPLLTGSDVLGVVVLRPNSGDDTLAEAGRRTIEALAERTAAALESMLWAERHDRARVEVEAERLRTAILSSLSHDLRTPLSSIEGAASSLVYDGDTLTAPVRREMAETIVEESRRMTRLVGNLLDMVRVETGGLAVRKAWQPLEEVLGVALVRLEGRLGGHPVETRLPRELPLVPVDELLIEQVFINLLENAVKYTPTGTLMTVSAWEQDGMVLVEVADRGLGVPAGSEEAVFTKFYRGAASEVASGAGLGLTICRGIVAAHGGRIWVQSNRGGGAAFRFTLPLVGPPMPALPPDLATP